MSDGSCWVRYSLVMKIASEDSTRADGVIRKPGEIGLEELPKSKQDRAQGPVERRCAPVLACRVGTKKSLCQAEEASLRMGPEATRTLGRKEAA